MSSDVEATEARDTKQMHGRDLTTGSIPRHLMAFSMPMLLGSALQNAYTLINGVWVGRGLGKQSLAAITAGFPVFFVLVAVAFGLTMAASILVAQAYGARDWPAVRRVVQNSVVLVGIAGAVFLVLGQLLAEGILRAMDTPADVLPLATRYLHVYLYTLPLNFGVFLLASLLRGAGDSKTPLYFQAAGLGLVTVLDPVLMFGLLGFPRLGLVGTGYAGIAANAVAFAGLAAYLHAKRHIVSPDWLRPRADWETIWITLRIGVPTMVQQSLVSLCVTVVVGLVNRFGEDAAAGFGAAIRVEQLALLPALTVGAAVSSMAGQNIGAGRYDRVREVFWWGAALGGGITLAVTLLAVTIPHALMLMFTSDPMVLDIGTGYLRVVALGYVMFAIMFVSNGVINGAGHTLVTTAFTLTSLWAVRVPLAVVLTGRLHAVEGVWYAVVAGFTVGALLSVSYYLSGRWKRPIVRQTREGVEPVPAA